MGVAIVAGLSAVLGALVGGAATFAVGWLGSKSQREQAARERSHTLSDRRHDSHVAYLRSVDAFMDKAGLLAESLRDGSEPGARTAAHSAYVDAWTGMAHCVGAAQLAGPADLVGQVVQLENAMSMYGGTMDEWWILNTSHDEWEQKRLALRDKAHEIRQRYVDNARRSFYGA